MPDDTQNLPGDTGQGDGAVGDDGQQAQDGSNDQGNNGQGDTLGDQQASGGEDQPAQVALTPEQIAIREGERAFQRSVSWWGRERQEFADAILGSVKKLVDSQRANAPPALPSPLSTIDAATLLDRPGEVLGQFVRRDDIPKYMAEEQTKQTLAEQTFKQDLVRHAAAVMEADSLFADKDLGKEVVQEMIGNINAVDRRLPANVAAQLLVNGAVASIVRKRAATKANPLAGNRPIGPGNGTIKAGAPAAVKPTPVKLDNMTKMVMQMFGNKDEDVQTMLAGK